MKTVRIEKSRNPENMRISLIECYEYLNMQMEKEIEQLMKHLEENKNALEYTRNNILENINIDFYFNNVFTHYYTYCDCCGERFDWGKEKIHFYDKNDSKKNICVDCALYFDPILRTKVKAPYFVDCKDEDIAYDDLYPLVNRKIYPISKYVSIDDVREEDKQYIIEEELLSDDDLSDAFPSYEAS